MDVERLEFPRLSRSLSSCFCFWLQCRKAKFNGPRRGQRHHRTPNSGGEQFDICDDWGWRKECDKWVRGAGCDVSAAHGFGASVVIVAELPCELHKQRS